MWKLPKRHNLCQTLRGKATGHTYWSEEKIHKSASQSANICPLEETEFQTNFIAVPNCPFDQLIIAQQETIDMISKLPTVLKLKGGEREIKHWGKQTHDDNHAENKRVKSWKRKMFHIMSMKMNNQENNKIQITVLYFK